MRQGALTELVKNSIVCGLLFLTAREAKNIFNFKMDASESLVFVYQNLGILNRFLSL